MLPITPRRIKDKGTVSRQMSTLTANLFWKPLRQLKLGWQAAYAQRKFYNLAGEKGNVDGFQASFGAWSYF